jgi:5-oxoprolinase (ATP-hydrolysing)
MSIETPPTMVDPRAPAATGWRIWVDTGGTFTDCLAVDPGGRPRRAKVLSTSALRGRIVGTEGEAAVRVRGG